MEDMEDDLDGSAQCMAEISDPGSRITSYSTPHMIGRAMTWGVFKAYVICFAYIYRATW